MFSFAYKNPNRKVLPKVRRVQSSTMRLIILGLLIVVVTAAAMPATSFGGPGRCRCDCPLNEEVCAKEGNAKPETFASKCQVECFNCTQNKEYVVIHKGKCPD
ncbi:hypothetical protein J437_LFUL014842 [Ladona fulva]|uniref:Uncharacterized protein n=1 Tax=Ladona fulva TaxID=123851 RepID=A0A8K0KG41_LADFU|nr:hypothetical protein J437_LFUL014842 [Ladona fulva]